MMSLDHFEVTHFDALVGLHPDVFSSLVRQFVAGPITISERARRIVECLRVNVFQISGVVSADPTKIRVMSDIRKRKSEASVASEVPSFVTVHVTLVNLSGPEERKMRI